MKPCKQGSSLSILRPPSIQTLKCSNIEGHFPAIALPHPCYPLVDPPQTQRHLPLSQERNYPLHTLHPKSGESRPHRAIQPRVSMTLWNNTFLRRTSGGEVTLVSHRRTYRRSELTSHRFLSPRWFDSRERMF